MSLLEVRNLHTYFATKRGPIKAVSGVSFSIDEGEIVGLAGESGSGKTITALSIMRLLPKSAHIDKGEIVFRDRNLLKLSGSEMVKIRGTEIAMIFQEPDLNRIMTVESQLREVFPGASTPDLVGILEEVGIPDAHKRLKAYPFEMSGGMKQRIMIAMMALTRSPKILIADEPTTALDVTIQAQILALLEKIVRDKGMGMLLITHNLALLAEHSDRIIVMRNGEIVEAHDTARFFSQPEHPYSVRLLRDIPRIDEYRREIAQVKENAVSVVRANNLSIHFPVHKGSGLMKKRVASVCAVDDVSFSVVDGETFGIVGESGCGKTTLARTILRLIPKGDMERAGSVTLNLEGENRDIYLIPDKALSSLRQNVQIVFQEAQGALNPRRSVGDLVVEGLVIHKKISPLGCDDKAKELLELVGIDPGAIDRFPAQFSSGQRQRITIARALALEPKILILDEPVASLDVSVQKEVVDLLLGLKDRLGLTYIVISHELALVKDIAHRIAVMYLGKIVEVAPSRELMQNPLHPYTKALISAVPIPDPIKAKNKERIILKGEIPSPSNVPSGCRFRTRCPYARELCVSKEPPLIEYGSDRFTACHYTQEIKDGMHVANAN